MRILVFRELAAHSFFETTIIQGKGDFHGDRSKTRDGATFGVYAVILAVYFVIPDMGYISPSLSAIGERYGVDAGTASYLSTIVSLTQIVSALVCGIIAGKYVSRKVLLSIAVTGMAVFGALPAFFSPETVPFEILMADRAVFGLFLGFLQPVIFAFVANVFRDEDRRATAYGIGNVSFNVGAVFASSVGGICVGIGWNTAFWLYLIGLVVLVFVLVFYKEFSFGNPSGSKGGKNQDYAPCLVLHGGNFHRDGFRLPVFYRVH